MRFLSLSRRVILASLIAAPALARPPARPPSRRISLTVAIDAHGRVTPQWIGLIRGRIDANELAGVQLSPHALSAEESQWLAAIRTAAPQWIKGVARLDAPFRQARPPATIQAVVGDQGGDDAFAAAPDTIAFDLSALANAYDAGDAASRVALIGRLLSREYTRLLTDPYLAGLGWAPDHAARDPLLAVLRALYAGGLSTLRCLEGDALWTRPDGTPTDLARKTLAQLQPIMVERLKAIAAAPSPQAAAQPLHDLDRGSLARQWGALPIGLWLAADTGFAPERIAAWVEAKPDGILDLAIGQADRKYRRALADIKTQAVHAIAAEG